MPRSEGWWPWVSRGRYAEVVADRDFYRAALLKLTLPDPKKPAPPPKSDEDMVREAEAAFVARAKRAETEFVTRLTDDLVRQGFNRSDAEKEAKRLRAESTSTTLHPGA